LSPFFSSGEITRVHTGYTNGTFYLFNIYLIFKYR